MGLGVFWGEIIARRPRNSFSFGWKFINALELITCISFIKEENLAPCFIYLCLVVWPHIGLVGVTATILGYKRGEIFINCWRFQNKNYYNVTSSLAQIYRSPYFFMVLLSFHHKAHSGLADHYSGFFSWHEINTRWHYLIWLGTRDFGVPATADHTPWMAVSAFSSPTKNTFSSTGGQAGVFFHFRLCFMKTTVCVLIRGNIVAIKHICLVLNITSRKFKVCPGSCFSPLATLTHSVSTIWPHIFYFQSFQNIIFYFQVFEIFENRIKWIQS